MEAQHIICGAVCLVLSAGGVVAQADLTPTAPYAHTEAQCSAPSSVASATPAPTLVDAAHGLPLAIHVAAADPPAVIDLPDAPDSAALLLYALSTVGVWQITRYSRRLACSPAPDWYHTAAPERVGNAHVLSWDASDIDWPTCYGAEPPGEPEVVWSARSERVPRLPSRAIPIIAPRGPPLV